MPPDVAGGWRGALHLLALWVIGCGQPLLSSVRDNLDSSAPDILAGQSRATVLAFVVLVLLVPPGAAWLLTLAARRLWPAATVPLHLLLIAGLAGAVALAAFASVRGYLSAWNVVPAALLAVGAAVLYVRAEAARMFLSLLAVTAVAFALLFLLRPPVSKMFLASPPPPARAASASTPPVTVVVLDEFPLGAIESTPGRIDPHYPNFRALAREGTWYPRATTVHDFTNKAVPAMLTGRVAPAHSLPYWFDHRQSLFTDLNGVARMTAVEHDEELCPPGLCRSAAGSDPGLGDLLSNAARGWMRALTNGRVGKRPYEDASAPLAEFTRALRPRPEGGLAYIHVLLPHDPYVRDAEGRRYGDPQAPQPGLTTGDVWTSADGARLSRRRLRAQAVYLDTLIGRLRDRLKALGDYERGLFVVVADHGAAFLPGHSRRIVGPAQVQDIASVPLFVRYPRGRGAGRSNLPARNVDVRPTILEALGRPIPKGLGGRPLQRGGSGTDVVTVHPSSPGPAPVSIRRSRLEELRKRESRAWNEQAPTSDLP